MNGLRHLSWPVSRREMQTHSQSSTFVILSIADTLINSFECKQVSSVTRCIRTLMLAQERDGLFTDFLINHCTNWLKSVAGTLLLGHTAFMHNHVNKPSRQMHEETAHQTLLLLCPIIHLRRKKKRGDNWWHYQICSARWRTALWEALICVERW